VATLVVVVEREVVVEDVLVVVLYVNTVVARVTPRKLEAKSRVDPEQAVADDEVDIEQAMIVIK
jgi:hypothetical protein